MKKILLLLTIFAATFSIVISQIPDKIDFQAIARNAQGDVLAQKNISLRISVIEGPLPGRQVYEEIHQLTTDQFGLFVLKIGEGIPMTHKFSDIDWSGGSHFIQTAMDPQGSDNYIPMGTIEILSVPYAFYAREVENADDADADPQNELQTISISGTQLTLSQAGGTVTLPTVGDGGDNWGTQKVVSDNTLTGEGTPASPLTIAQQSASNGQILHWDGNKWTPSDDQISDADADPNNEMQSLILEGNYLSITPGNTVELPINPRFSGLWDDLIGIPGGFMDNIDDVIDADASPTNEIQRLNLVGSELSIEAGNTVKLPTYSTFSGEWKDLKNTPAGFADNFDDVNDEDNDPTNEIQTLTATGPHLSISGGNTITFSGVWSTEQEGKIYYDQGSVVIGTDATAPDALVGLHTKGNYRSGIVATADMTSGTAVVGLTTDSLGENAGGLFITNGERGVGVSGIANLRRGQNYGGRFKSFSTEGYGAYGEGPKYGLYGKSTTYAVYGEANNTDENCYGGFFMVSGNTGTAVTGVDRTLIGNGVLGTSTGATGRGVYGVASHSTGINAGGFFQTYSLNGHGVQGKGPISGVYGESLAEKGRAVTGMAQEERSIGVRGIALAANSTGVWGEGAAYDFYANGPGVDYGTGSSIRWKKDIEIISEPIQKIMQLRGVTFNWDSQHGGQHDVGMIAEEVGKVLPEIVVYEENGTDAIGMDYSKLTPLLIEAVKNLIQLNDQLTAQNNDLQKRVSNLEKRVFQIDHKSINPEESGIRK